MSLDPTVYVFDVLHKAPIEVTEAGTGACAATAVVMKKIVRGQSLAPPIDLTFDRLVLMLVVHC